MLAPRVWFHSQDWIVRIITAVKAFSKNPEQRLVRVTGS
jgi:hypothetical protein